MQPRPVPPSDDETEEARLEWLAVIVRKYLIKVQQEREERLAGRIVAADFSVRQLTCLEVALDLMGGGGFQALIDFRAGGHDLVQIAETPMSYLLGKARRQKWAELGEPARPELPPRHFLVERDGSASSRANIPKAACRSATRSSAACSMSGTNGTRPSSSNGKRTRAPRRRHGARAWRRRLRANPRPQRLQGARRMERKADAAAQARPGYPSAAAAGFRRRRRTATSPRSPHPRSIWRRALSGYL